MGKCSVDKIPSRALIDERLMLGMRRTLRKVNMQEQVCNKKLWMRMVEAYLG
jgi:hypothetical protein